MEAFDTDEAIKSICQALKEEAEAVISYTDKLSDDETTGLFEKIRLDEVEHIQNLCIELTKLITKGSVPFEETGGD